MSRFAIEKVEWPGGEEGAYDAQPIARNADGRWEPGEPVLCVPATAYEALLEVATELARCLDESDGWIRGEFQYPGWEGKGAHQHLEACSAAMAQFNGEADDAAKEIPAAPLDDFNAMTEAGRQLARSDRGGKHD